VRDDGQVVAAVAAPLQPVEVGGVPAQADGGNALADAAHDLGAHALFHVDADVAVRRVLQEARDVFGQRLGHDRGRRQDAHMPARAAGIGGHVALDAVRAAEHGARVLQQVSPAGVGTTPRRLRSSSGVPTASSSCASRLLMAEPTMLACSPARAMLRVSQTATNRRRVVRSRSLMMFRFGSKRLPKYTSWA
jgi:hypothetical protein